MGSGVRRCRRVLSIALAVGLTACGDPTGPAAGTFTPSEPGVLVVATNLPAPGFWEGPPDAPTGGFEHGIAVAIMEEFGLTELRVVNVPFDRLVAGDLAGADLALAQITPTDERDGVLDFTTAYLDAHPAVLAPDGTEVADLAAARELRWAVQIGSTHTDLLEERIRPEAVQRLDDIDAVVDAVASGTADVALLDLPTALVEERLTDGALRAVAQFATDDVLAIAVPEGSDDLEALDSAVRRFLDDGTIERLGRAWLGDDVADGTVDVPLIRAKPVG